jgi:predicted transcriptional regulator
MDQGDASLAVRLPADLLRHARSVAESRDETLSQVVRRTLRAYVASGPRQLDLLSWLGRA